MANSARPNDNPAQIKGDIQHGRTGDKRPGFDPAAAPLETDSEAGGKPLSARQVETARRAQAGDMHSEEQVSYNNAMREFDEVPRRGSWSLLAVAAIAVGLAIIGIVVLAA